VEKLYSAASERGANGEGKRMSFWYFDISAGRFFLDFAWLGALLVLGLIIRNRVAFLRRALVPANLAAGVLGLLLGANGLGLIDLTSERLGIYVYHLLALLFIGLSLRAPQKKIGLSSVKTGMLFIITYLLQGIIGLLIAFGLIYTVMPDLFAGIGLLPPLAFGMNPGIAYTIGHTWEGFGFEAGGIVGLTFAAVGFFAAYTTGIWLVRRGIQKGEAEFLETNAADSWDDYTDLTPAEATGSTEKFTIPPGILESLSFHFGLIGLVYLATFGFMSLTEWSLTLAGAENEAETLWAFHFIFAAVLALGFRKIVDYLGADRYLDDSTLTRTSNLFMDLMIAASVAAISLAVIGAYWLPLLLISLAVVAATWFTLTYLCNSLFSEFRLERLAAIYGNMTGTLQSGLLLLRILDEHMKSPVSHNLVYGSGLALVLGFPLLLLINAPVHYFDDVTNGFWIVLMVMALYLGLLLLALYYLNGKNEK